MNAFGRWLEQHQLPCLYKYFAGTNCPGCGMQRAMIDLVNGDLGASVKMYPPLLPLIFTLVFLGIHLKYKVKNGSRILLFSYSFTALLIVVNFVVKEMN